MKNGLTTLLLFLLFFLNAKNLGRSDDAEGRKKEDGLIKHGSHNNGVNFCRSKLNLSSVFV